MRDLFRLKQMAVPAGLVLTPVNIPANMLAVAAPPVAAGGGGGGGGAAAAPAVAPAAPAVAAPVVAPVVVPAAPAPRRTSAYDPRFDLDGKRI